MSSPESRLAINLGRELKDRGLEAEMLWCDMDLRASCSMSAPDALRITRLPASATRDLSEFWLDTIRFLEERAPCFYLSSPHGNAGWIYPRLSNRILIAPLLHRDDRASYDHTRFLGKYCNALIALDPELRLRLFADFPSLAKRVVRPESEDAAGFVASLGRRLNHQVIGGIFRRPHRVVTVPRLFWTDLGGAKKVQEATKLTNRIPIWPVPVRSSRSGTQKNRRGNNAGSLSDYRITVGVTSGRISGVDIFSADLVRGLRARGYRAEIIQTLGAEKTPDPLPLRDDVPVTDLGLAHARWARRWKALREYLEAEPTIYVPNYDEKHSAVAPTLSQNVRVVGIVHSDDPQHYNHILRLAPYWDAVVTVSEAIREHLAVVSPELIPRTNLIPYGVKVKPSLDVSPRTNGSPLRAVYAGRIMRYQKRVFDLLQIANGIRDDHVNAEVSIVGAGPDLDRFVAEAGPLFVDRTLRWVGTLGNEALGQLLHESHAFILPSRFEGLPVSVLEAMAIGCVPIVTGIRSGIRELIRNGENGFVVDVGDIDRFVEALARLEQDEPMRVRMATAAHATILANYSIEAMIDSYIGAFQEMLARDYVRPKGKVIVPPALRGVLGRIPDPPPMTRNVFWRVAAMFR
jgi:glycosyltransferase involved in cell wall biosynthesis